MRRSGNLFGSIASFAGLFAASRKARRGKRTRPDVAAFEFALEPELLALERELADGTYRPRPHRTFTILEPKPRLISAAPYRDRVVHHALMTVIEPIFERTFVHDSYSCRKLKGTHRALDRFTYHARRHPYVLKADIAKYFPSIDHEILKRLLARSSRTGALARRFARGLVGTDQVRASLASWLGHARHASTDGLVRSVLGKLRFTRSQAVPS